MNQKQNLEIRDGFDRMDFGNVTGMLSKVFWSSGIKKDEVIQGATKSALLTGVFDGDRQIAFARVVSDKTRFAYIMDVVVHEDYRKQGIGQLMIRHILGHPDLKDVYQWLLKTRDAHGVYEKTGFRVVSDPESWMEIMPGRPER